MLKVLYEAQPKKSRKCGAYCVRMILKSKGISSISAEQIWLKLKSKDNRGGKFIKTQALVKELNKHGLQAIAITSPEPLKILDACIRHNVDVILGCRQYKNTDHGHFMVLVDSDSEHITLQDPHPDGGSNRKISRDELAQLFKGLGSNSELPDGLLILIKQDDVIEKTEQFNCPQPHCRQSIFNYFVNVLGEFDTCSALADRLLCTKCDKLFPPIRTK